MHYNVVSVKPLEHLRLAVRFADGLTGEVVFKHTHLHGVFEALTDPEGKPARKSIKHAHFNEEWVMQGDMK